ncbi:hypothetical protein [Pseudomonas fluorescens]|uniref:hypothetical protein n=1 Tax=Pseudomonas fluorescens TaxID=294 RepID=UPI00117A5DF2|nr:hypothetical protein [Pseudomonas fluorescens]
MELTVRVMSCGKEVDRIACPLQIDGRRLAVIYRERLCPVEDGCIHVENGIEISGPDQRPGRPEWGALVAHLVPKSLPERREECSELLRVIFKDNLPDGVVRAFSSLAFMGLEQDAHELLVDFLCEKYDAISLSRQLQTQLFCSEISSAVVCSANSDPTFITSETNIESDAVAEDESLQGWDWTAADEIQIPEIDDRDLRAVAGQIQGAIGTYRSSEKGTVIPSLVGPFDGALLNEESIPPSSARTRSPEERVLVERTAKLGTVALDLLRYFADNPGDRAAHAELVLGYNVTDINKILSGSLNHYLKKNQSGGWVCHPWVAGVLLVLDEAL